MLSTILDSIASLGYVAAGLASFVLMILLAARGSGQGSGRLLLLAIAAELLWSGLLVSALSGAFSRPALLVTGEALRAFAWIAFLASLIRGAAKAETLDSEQARALRRIAEALVAAAAAAGLVMIGASVWLPQSKITLVAAILAVVVALVAVEQVWLNTPAPRRWAMKFIALALLTKFVCDLAFFTEALLFFESTTEVWGARGFVNALLAPLVAVAAARNPAWKLDVGVSRRVVFHTATLMIAGAGLLLTAVAGYLLRYFGGKWGAVAATTLAFASCVGLIAVLTSTATRSRLRLFLAKNFFSYRYDYREEWLRLTRLISESPAAEGTEGSTIQSRAIVGLTHLTGSPGGALWMRNADGEFALEATVKIRDLPTLIAAEEPVIRAMAEGEWAIELDAAGARASDPSGAAGQADARRPPLPAWLAARADAALLVPLMLENDLVGLVLLRSAPNPQPLDWETRDLLKVTARQIAAFLVQRRVVEELIEARQFESYNKMSAFVVHDLKNLLAQFGLLTRNARTHGQNPEFQQDMLETVQFATERLQSLLRQIQVDARPIDRPESVPLRSAIDGAVRLRRSLKPEPVVEIDPRLDASQVTAHPARLERVLGHLLQNAAEATTAEGSVSLKATCEGRRALIEITDNGVGMSEDFVRTGLFKPFRSTKATGMGIGAFESREYLREIGGSVEVDSRPNEGTTFKVWIPLREADA